MRVRAQSPTGDYTFGQGSANFLINSPAAVAQLVETRLLLWVGEWFLDTTVGTPWLQEILGNRTKPYYDLALKAVILGTVAADGTPLVTKILDYASSIGPGLRALAISGKIDTIYGAAEFNVSTVGAQWPS